MINKFKNYIKVISSPRSLVNSTALICVGNPVYAYVEKTFLGMSDTESINAKFFGSAITYLGIGCASIAARDFTRTLCKLTQQSSEFSLGLHDTLNSVVFASLVAIPMYTLASGIYNPRILAEAAVTAGCISLATGWAGNYAADTFRDLAGIEPSPRLPKQIRNLPSSVKKGLVALVLGASITATSMVYTYKHQTPKKVEHFQEGNLER